ncbi:hypothetical protein E1A91_A02G175500v1 [Gossypium mustelinum]|uniref:Ionotropic glutamate receptor C-terminal domain-containing protein n=1 Tax=Gossypium mustelinum TaxID=34275 RepID=A0A5D3A6S8_GOSMU|nr:hypothetical protein E1A91_A02G175500v1 [Gossypium mustelinum]
MQGATFTKLFAIVLLLLLSSKCSGTIDGADQEDVKADVCMHCVTARDTYQIQLQFNHLHGGVKPIDLDDHYQNCVAIKNLTAHRHKLPILCTVTKYETAFSMEVNEFAKRTKATILCALPARAEATMINESSTSYMSRHMYEIVRDIARAIGNFPWMKLKPGLTMYKSDRISDLDIVTFSLNSRQPQNASGIVQLDATLSFLASKPVHCYKKLSIGVPVRSIPRQFINISHDKKNYKETQITGFWVDIFKEATSMMSAGRPYNLVPFYGSDDQLFKELARRVVEFSYPYIKVGTVVVIKENLEMNQFFSFMIPFTNKMWFTLAAIIVFNAFVIRLVESGTRHESIGAIFWIPLATLFYGGHKESPRNNLTNFVLASWFILILVVSSTYTTSFTSMITSSDTESSSYLDIEIIKKTNATMGCDMEDSIMLQHLVEVIGFQRKNIKHIAQSSFDDYAKALSTENIKAAFFWTPYAEVFLAKYCKGFRAWSPSHGLREAIELLIQSGKLKQMKEDMLSLSYCSSSTNDGTMKRGIGPGLFSGFFMLLGSVSAIVLVIMVIRLLRRRWERLVQGMLMGRDLWVWLTTLFSRNQRGNMLQVQLARIS